MNTTSRVLLTPSLLSAAVWPAPRRSRKTPPADTGPTDTGAGRPTAPTAAGAYGPNDLDTDACLRQRVVYFDLDQDALKSGIPGHRWPATPSTCVTVRPRA